MFGLMKRSEPKDKLKEEITKNKELILDVMSESIQGARICPLIQKKCLGKFCEFFHDYNTNNGGKYSRCSDNQAPALMLELLLEMRRLNNALLGVVKETAEEIKKK